MILGLDHLAFRLNDKDAGMGVLSLLGYKLADKFDLDFEEEGKVEAYVTAKDGTVEVFMSDGDENTVVGKWVKKNGPGIHHLAFITDNIESDIGWFKANGYKFTSETYQECDDLKQIFTEPIEALGGIVIELIDRKTKGFCKGNVKALMESTKEYLDGSDG